ncbi:MAG: Holliday junction DNA helicase RuvB C-terminal domain-containing protein, partial [Pseudobdellovibrionaceae bacterium]
IVERFQFYDKSALEQILQRSAVILKTQMNPDGGSQIAKRSRGTPRVANRLLKRVRDYAQVLNGGIVDEKTSIYGLDQLGVDQYGLDLMDRKILTLIHEKYANGPVGIETLAAALSEDRGTLEEVYEPYLIQEGLIQKTQRGRCLTDFAKSRMDALILE